MLHFNKLLLLFIFLFFLHNCTALPEKSRYSSDTIKVIKSAEGKGFISKTYQTTIFRVAVWEKLSPYPKTIHVYIEGDGNSWKSKHVLSKDPTPRHPLGFKLALRDPHSEVMYIARPCQYQMAQLDPHCEPRFWSQARYGKEVFLSLHALLDHIKQDRLHLRFLLIGFSGGGNIAAILSAERQDVVGFITVAGNLDHERLSQYHQTTPLRGSLNAKHYLDRLKNIPQKHLIGENDRIVPPWVARDFVTALNSPCATYHLFETFSHQRGWDTAWPALIQEPLPNCS